MRPFELHRDEDETGLSGTGVVAEGVEFYDGSCAMRWRSPLKSTAVYESIRVVEALHGHGGKTRIVWAGEGRGWGVVSRPVNIENTPELPDFLKPEKTKP